MPKGIYPRLNNVVDWTSPEAVRTYYREWQRQKHNRKPRQPATFDAKAYARKHYEENRAGYLRRGLESHKRHYVPKPKRSAAERLSGRKASARKYRTKNLQKILHRNNVRRARKLRAPGVCTYAQWLSRVEYRGWRCVYCGKSLIPTTLTQDHQIPLARGGTNWPANLVPACQSCNSKKGVKSPLEGIFTATINVFEVEFQIKKPASGGPGKADAYRLPARKAVVSAASAHSKDILVPLTNNITLGTGEVFDILAVKPTHIGTEGANVLS